MKYTLEALADYMRPEIKVMEGPVGHVVGSDYRKIIGLDGSTVYGTQ